MKLLVGVVDALFILLLILGCLTFTSLGGAEKPPEALVFESKLGNVTFDHAKHVERASGDCTACHDKLFPQSELVARAIEEVLQAVARGVRLR